MFAIYQAIKKENDKMELLERLELVEVQFEDNNQKAVLIFLDEAQGEIREVNFNRQTYDKNTNKFVENAEKAAQVDEWCKEYFDLPFERLAEAIGERKDVYCYDRFSSLWETAQIVKFDEDMVGQIFEAEVNKAFDDGTRISIQFEYEGEQRESKMQYAEFIDARQAFFVNPVKQKKQYEKFKEKFDIDIENISDLVGKTVMCEVKKAMGKYVYTEIKPFPKKKKKK
jgi:hypothetical protein